MIKLNPLLLTDGYKIGHHQQYPEGTTLVYSNFTPRSNKYAPLGCGKVVSFGQQMALRQIHDAFERDFFGQPKDVVCGEIKEEMSLYLGVDYDVSHFEALHDLGYLPIKVRIIPEGNIVPIKVPVLTIYNTLPEFYWVTNYLETILSTLLWKPITSATIAKRYRELLDAWAKETDPDNLFFVNFQGHDFSMRGMDSIDACIASGMGHLTSFLGTDTLPAIAGARYYYNTPRPTPIGHSVNATEHSVMCAGTGFYIKDQNGDWEKYGNAELQVFRRLITEVYPTGIVSIVSDTWDLWKVLTEYLPELKDEILARDGKVVIRPDSGDPVDIICGFEKHKYEQKMDGHFYNGKKIQGNIEAQYKGVIELLWDIFGGTVNKQGYKVLDPHIGAIYGDSITLERANQICQRLAAKEFASTNVVLGIGSFTYQYNTRDTFGFAMKATYAEVNGEGFEIYKDPITDDGVKKSARGLLKVLPMENGYELVDKVSWVEAEFDTCLEIIYQDGEFFNPVDFTTVRERLNNSTVSVGEKI